MKPIMLRSFLVVMVIGGARVALPAPTQTPLETVLAAFHAEELTHAERTTFTFIRGGTVDVYMIERLAPDRLHMVKKTGKYRQELYVIGNTIYWQGLEGWKKAPGGRQSGLSPSLTGLFRTHLTDVKEGASKKQGGFQRRVFYGAIAWTQSGASNQGKLNITIDVATGLPTELTFSGTCGKNTCSFQQTLEYDSLIKIEPPNI